MLSGAGRAFTYDRAHRVQSITTGGVTTTFVYDAFGARVKKVSGADTTVYVGGTYEKRNKNRKSILDADPSLPIYTAAITPKGVEAAAEVADGFFPVWMNPERYDLFAEPIRRGLEKGGRDPKRFEEQAQPLRRLAQHLRHHLR